MIGVMMGVVVMTMEGAVMIIGVVMIGMVEMMMMIVGMIVTRCSTVGLVLFYKILCYLLEYLNFSPVIFILGLTVWVQEVYSSYRQLLTSGDLGCFLTTLFSLL